MALPNFKNYFYVVQIKPLNNMCTPSYCARWKDIELSIMNDPPIQAVLAHKNLGKLIDNLQNPWIKFNLKIWNMIKREYKLDHKLQILQWCAYDPGFKPNEMDHRFKSWIPKGITTYYSLTDKGQLKNFEHQREKYRLEKSDFYRYLQISNHFEHNIRNTIDLDEPILRIFLGAYQNESNGGIISKSYKGLMTKKSHTAVYVKEKWERDGNLSISNEDWLDVCKFQWKCTNSHIWREFAWKCVIRFFITPKQKARFAGGDATCWRRCGAQEANHWHIFWECPVIRPFWADFHQILEIILNTDLPLEFATLFLGKLDFQTGRQDKYMFGILITACKKALTRRWLLPEPPTIQEWIDIVNDIYAMERITFSLRLQRSMFIQLWDKWVKYANPIRTDPVEIINE